jgi:hypothetical protein
LGSQLALGQVRGFLQLDFGQQKIDRSKTDEKFVT